MSTPPVYWHEGMFLRPHHFQAAERFWADQLRISGRFDVQHNWGLRVADIDTDALRNYRFEVHRLAARFRDGTLVTAEKGTDQALDALDLKPLEAALGPGQTIDVLLAVPALQIGRANTGGTDDTGVRFRADHGQEPVPDENTGQNPNYVPVRRLNARLITSEQNATGFETLPIARLTRSLQASAPLQLHPEYIPPVLACDGWRPLDTEVIGQIYNRVGGLVKKLARQVKDQNIKFDTNNPEQRKIFERLRALNEAYAAFGVVAQARGGGIHPLQGYLELCRLVGKLVVFSKDATFTDDLPVYDHDDLGHCFFTVKRLVDDLLSLDFNQGYEVRPFKGEGLRMRVNIDPAWLAPACQLLVGVESNLPPDQSVKLLTGRLNMKIGALERVDDVFIRGLRGLDFVHDHKPPAVLPTPPTVAYFQIKRDASKDEWAFLTQTYNLAIRFNEKLLVGTMDGKQEVTIQSEAKTATMKFTLYVVLPAAQGS